MFTRFLVAAMLCALGPGLSACFSEVGPTRQIEEPSPGAPPPPPPPTPYDDGGRPSAPPPNADFGTPTTPSPNNQPDADKDGVIDGQDQCSHTSAGKLVWKTGAWAGCAAGQLKDSDDGDRDGVPNGQDNCAGTPIGTPVYTSGSSAGCPTGGPPPPPPPPPPKQDSGTPPPPPPPPGFTLSAKEKDLLAALNKARANNGLPAVAADAKLTCAARMHATDVAGGCDHTGSDGSWPWDRAQTCGFAQSTWTVNEICAGPGFTSGSDAVSGWKQSSGHWAALISNQAKLVGLGVGANGCYVALFDCCVKSM